MVQPGVIPHRSGKDEAESSSSTQRRRPSCLSRAIPGVSGGDPVLVFRFSVLWFGVKHLK